VKKSQSGSIFALTTALCFGLTVPLSKLLLDDIEPWMLAGILYLGGGLGLLPIYYLRNLLHPSKESLRPKDWTWLGASILSGGVTAPVLLTIGLTTTPATVGSLLLNFEGVFTALLAWTIFKERWHLQIFLGIVAITCGGIILSYTEHTNVGLSWGAVAILGTCLGWAMDSNLTNVIADRDPLQIAVIKSGIAGLINVAIAYAIGQTLPPLTILIPALAIGFISSGLTYVCFVQALRQLGAARTGAYFALSPFVGAAISVLFLGEQITQVLVISAILMAVGVGLCLQEP
jgi:drug/metabolite transporter (DMT)-like permease